MSVTRIACSLLAALLATSAVQAGYVINVTPSVGPRADGSFDGPNGYAANATQGLSNGALTAPNAAAAQAALLANTPNAVGNPNSPTYYQPLGGSTVPASSILVTDFFSWLGTANPSGNFANESGNRLFYGLVIVGTDGDQFSLSQLSFSLATDPTLTPPIDVTFTNYLYSEGFVGLRFEGNTVVQVTDETELVDALIYRGSGTGLQVLAGGRDPQDAINQDVPKSPFDITGTWSLGGEGGTTIATGSATVTVLPAAAVATPEPASALLLGIGFAGIAVRRRLRR